MLRRSRGRLAALSGSVSAWHVSPRRIADRLLALRVWVDVSSQRGWPSGQPSLWRITSGVPGPRSWTAMAPQSRQRAVPVMSRWRVMREPSGMHDARRWWTGDHSRRGCPEPSAGRGRAFRAACDQLARRGGGSHCTRPSKREQSSRRRCGGSRCRSRRPAERSCRRRCSGPCVFRSSSCAHSIR